MKFQDIYKKWITEAAPTQDSQRIQQAYSFIGYRENNRAKQILVDIQGEEKAEASYLLAIIALLEKNDTLAQSYLDQASSDAEYSLLNYAQSKKEIPSDVAKKLESELRKKGLEAYASLCACYQTLDSPSQEVQDGLLQQLSHEVKIAERSINLDSERSARRNKDKMIEGTITKLETKRKDDEKAGEKKRAKNRPSSAPKKATVKKTEATNGIKIVFTILKIARFFFAYIIPVMYLFAAFSHTLQDDNCAAFNKVIIVLPLLAWLCVVCYVKFKVLKSFEEQNERVTGAWWLFYLPTTFMLIYRTFLARQEALSSAGTCLLTALLTCILLAPQLIFMLPLGKTPRTREDFYSAALCGVICFIIFPMLCMTFTDMTMDTIGQGINAAIQTHK